MKVLLFNNTFTNAMATHFSNISNEHYGKIHEAFEPDDERRNEVDEWFSDFIENPSNYDNNDASGEYSGNLTYEEIKKR